MAISNINDINDAFKNLGTALEVLQTHVVSAIGGASGASGAKPSAAKGKFSSGNNYGFSDSDKVGAGRLSDEKLLNKLQIERFKYAKKYASEYKKVQDNLEKIANLTTIKDSEILEIEKKQLEIEKQIELIGNKKNKKNSTGPRSSQAKLERLKKQKAGMVENSKVAISNYDKELKKQSRSTAASIMLDDAKNAAKDKGVAIVNKGAESLLDFVKNTISSAFEQDSIMSKLAANYSLTANESFALKNNILNASMQTLAWGVNTEELVKMQSIYTDDLGRSVMLGEEGMVSLAKMGVATGIGAEGAASMAASMELFGYSAQGATNQIQELIKDSRQSGMSTSVMTKKLQDNLKIANSYTFKDGIDGVEKMTVYSSKFRINMQSIASFADKVSNPEGAIKTAASLQVLGGSFAQMADPLKMLDQGINDMEGLTKTYNDMLDGLAKVDRKTGEVTINGYDRLRIKAAAEAT